MTLTLLQLAEGAERSVEPSRSSKFTPRPGGVDPLGLRQINFDLMDRVLPGINNVAYHIRPFTVVTWAWRRAAECARASGYKRIAVSDLQDFVDRIEVLYAWSQFLRKPNADLPGKDVLAPIVAKGNFRFGGKAWRQQQEIRRYSTSLSAPINYGPALKSLGWLLADPADRRVMIASPIVSEALTAFQSRIERHLDHAAFRVLGEITISSADVQEWAEDWALEKPTAAERKAMRSSFLGPDSRLRLGAELIAAASAHLGGSSDISQVRRTMCGAPTNFRATPELESTIRAWRILQARQLFRLALEAMFHWSLLQLDGGSKSTKKLVGLFLEQSGDAPSTKDWLALAETKATSPVDWLEQLQANLPNPERCSDLPKLIRKCLGVAFRESPNGATLERHDRLPVARANREAESFGTSSTFDFLIHVFESWVFGQHVYWAVGRGLADARAQGKTILRLKVILEEQGWTLAPGVSVSSRSAPDATPDRLETAISLLREACGI